MEEVNGLREYACMNYCFNNIPLKVKRGFTSVEVQFSSLDAVEEFIAIGTNIGVIYWCNRKTRKIERLRPEKCESPISFVKVVSTVDYMVAGGDGHGLVSIFMLPKAKPAFMFQDYQVSLRETTDRFTVSGIHSSTITAIEWSVNGQKVFTGDEKGVVAYTEIDFRLNITRSIEILNEKSAIVQLSYSQRQILVVATRNRCIVYNQADGSKIFQVDQKERTNLCELGAIISSHSTLAGTVIYSAGPQQRISLADTEGQILKTFLFKEALMQNYPKIKLLNFIEGSTATKNHVEAPLNQHSKLPACNLNHASVMEFNRLKIYNQKFLLAYNSTSLVLLNTEEIRVEAGLTTQKIMSVATNREEIFILEGHRQVRRLAYCDDPYILHKFSNADPTVDKPLGEMLRDMVKKIKEETSNNVVKPIMKKVEDVMDNVDVSPAEDALSLEKAFVTQPTTTDDPSELSAIQDENYKTVFRDGKKSCSGSPKIPYSTNATEAGTSSLGGGGGSDNTTSTTENQGAPPRPKLYVGDFNEVPRDIAPDLRTPDSILRDVLHKEMQLAQLLNIPADKKHILSPVVTEAEPMPIEEEEDFNFEPADSAFSETTFAPTDNEIEKSGMADSLNDSDEDVLEQSDDVKQYQNEIESGCEECWKQYNLPFVPKWICATNNGVYCGGPKLSVYYSNTKTRRLQWTRQKYRATTMSVSPSRNIWWKLNLNVAYACLQDLCKWKVVARNVQSIAVNETSAWYISKGYVYAQTNLTYEQPFSESVNKVDCGTTVKKIRCFDNNVWVLTNDGQILSRQEITNYNQTGSGWKKIIFPDHVTVTDFVLACRHSGWIIDQYNRIYFSDNYDCDIVDWWQVIIGQHVYSNEASLSDKLSKFVHWSKETVLPVFIGSDDATIWAVNTSENSIYVNRTAALGHRWVSVKTTGSDFSSKWKFITASGSNEESAALWCLNSTNDLFLYQLSTQSFRAIEAATTEDIICMTAVFGTLWLLTNQGKVFSRVGFTESHPFGFWWEELNLNKGNANAIKFKQLSCGPDVIWGIDCSGNVYAVETCSHDVTFNSPALKWQSVTDITPHNVKFVGIIVGPHKRMVWAIDNKHKVYVRQAISDDFPFGTEWICVSGIRAVQITISNSAVWALTTEGHVYRRFGISPDNYIGDYWVQISELFSLITTSAKEDLWGVSKMTGRLQRYEKHVLGLSEEFIRNRTFSENLEDDWEIV